jgi:hypothetical protein
MTYQRRAYDDQDSTPQMTSDCAACAAELDLPRRRVDVSETLVGPPSIAFEDFPLGKSRREITVSEAAAHLASRLHLHLD